MSRHNSSILNTNKKMYENTFLLLCDGNWIPSINVPMLDVVSTFININFPQWNSRLFSPQTETNFDIIYNFTLPNTGETFNRICLFRGSQVGDIPANMTVYNENGYTVSSSPSNIFSFDDIIYFPANNTVHRVQNSQSSYALINPNLPVPNNVQFNIINFRRGPILKSEAITPITASGQQISFKWTIDNGNRST